MILPNVQTFLCFDALDADAGAENLRETIDVDRLKAELLLDLAAHLLGPGFSAEDTDLEAQVADVDPLFGGDLGQEETVRRGTGENRRAEVLHDHQLLAGVAAAHRDDRGPDALGTIVGAEPAGEKPVTVGVVDDVALVGAGCGEGTGHRFGPVFDVAPGVADHRRLAGRARGGVDAHDLLEGHGEEAVGVVVAHVLLEGKRQALQIVEALDLVGRDACPFKALPVKRNRGVNALHGLLQALKLE